jgi:hypothetical protein
LQHYGYEKVDFLKNLWYNIIKVNKGVLLWYMRAFKI